MAIELNVLYEDNHIIVVEKPEGILSQGDSTNDLSMLEIIKDYLKEKYQKPGNVFLGLVHRLDRRVSGVMVFAKTSKAASRLSDSIRNHLFEKKYMAIVLGTITGNGRLVNKLEKKDGYAVESIEGKESILEYNVINNFEMDSEKFSVLDINLITGRYNQIRKQLSLINHPIVNDFKYGYNGLNYNDQFGLRCYKISFPHPISKEIMTFESNFENLWKEKIRKW